MTHSIVAPSSAYIWGKPDGCTAYPTMSMMYPEEETEESKEGSASHEIGANLILAGARGGLNSPTIENTVDQLAPNGVVYTREMFEGAQLYSNNVISVMRKHVVFGGPNLMIEEHLISKQIHEQSFGTIDAAIFAQSLNESHIYAWDYKFGFVDVDVYENWQLINYMAGIVEKFNLNGLADQEIIVHLRVIQPRAYHGGGPIKEWVIKLADLRPKFNQLHMGAHESLGPNAKARSGTHCTYCPARHACKAALDGGFALYEAASAPTPQEMSDEAMGVQFAIIRRALKHMESLHDGFEAQIKNKIKKGKRIPGWMIDAAKGRLEWNVPVADVIALGRLSGQDLKKPDDVLTPTQSIAAGIDESTIKSYSHRPKTTFKLKPEGNTAKLIFGGIK